MALLFGTVRVDVPATYVGTVIPEFAPKVWMLLPAARLAKTMPLFGFWLTGMYEEADWIAFCLRKL